MERLSPSLPETTLTKTNGFRERGQEYHNTVFPGYSALRNVPQLIHTLQLFLTNYKLQITRNWLDDYRLHLHPHVM